MTQADWLKADWLKLNTPDGEPVLVQVSRIDKVTVPMSGKNALVWTSGSTIAVRESITEIARLIGLEP